MTLQKPMRILAHAITLLSVVSLSCGSPGIRDPEKLQDKTNALLLSLDSLISHNYDKNKMISTRYVFIKNMLKSNNLKIHIMANPDSKRSIDFNFSTDNKELPFIGITEYLITLHEKQPSIIYSMIIHEYQHAYDYFTNEKNFRMHPQNTLEKYLYEMDAYYLEAQFVRDILIPNKFELTKFEKFLDFSLRNDNLSNFSFSFMCVDMDMVYKMVRLSRDRRLTRQEKIKNVQKIGDDILASFNYKRGDSLWDKYRQIVPLHSYYSYIVHILLYIEHYENRPTNDWNINKYPEIEANTVKMKELLDKYAKYLNSYRKGIFSDFMEF